MTAKYKPPAKPKVKKDGVHPHGCVRCKSRFEDACGDPKDWPLCADCRTGRAVLSPQLIANRRPIECCRQQARPIRDDEVPNYRTYQECGWFICPKCARTFPFHNPRDANV